MQYILSEEELEELKSTKEYDIKMSKVKLQELCSKIANTMPVEVYWTKTPEPWGCIIGKHEWYCDKCPVSKICPYEFKNWSK